MTLYDADVFLFDNPFNRYLINDRTKLHYNDDGSLDLYVQADQPTDPAQAQNWIPSPPGRLQADLAPLRHRAGEVRDPRRQRLAAARGPALCRWCGQRRHSVCVFGPAVLYPQPPHGL